MTGEIEAVGDLITAGLIARAVDPASGGVQGAALIAIPMHIFLQLKGAYVLGIGGALWRAGFLAISGLLVLLAFGVLLLALGVAI